MLDVSLSLSKIAVDRSNGNTSFMENMEVRSDRRTILVKDEPDTPSGSKGNGRSSLASSVKSNGNHEIVDDIFSGISDFSESDETEKDNESSTETVIDYSADRKNKKQFKSLKVSGGKKPTKHHGKRYNKSSYFCSLCGRVFHRESSKIIHEKLCKNAKYECKHCDFTSNSELGLKSHTNVHSDVYCDHCNKIFSNRWNLNQHKQSVAKKAIA